MLSFTRNNLHKLLTPGLSARAIIIISLFLCLFPLSGLAEQKLRAGIFLVATEHLHGTGFQEAVILLTHHSNGGTTGLTINRPTDIPLNQAFPRIRQLHHIDDPLYLGGPVSTNAIFVLINTTEPNKGMHLIHDNVYFSTGENAFRNPLTGTTRTFAGYAGWAPGQLQNEVSRGDWLVVNTKPAIIFEKDPSNLWRRLTNRWSGKWI